MTYQAASGAGAQNMRELLQQMGEVHCAAQARCSTTRPRAILDIDREVRRHPARRALPDRALRRAARRQPAALDRQGPRQRPEPRGVEGRARRPTRSSAATSRPIAGRRPLRAHRRDALPQPGAHDQADGGRADRGDRGDARRAPTSGCRSCRTSAKRRSSGSRRPRSPARSTFPSGACASCAWAAEYLSAFTVGDQLLWGAAEPLRRMLRILLTATRCGGCAGQARDAARAGREKVVEKCPT